MMKNFSLLNGKIINSSKNLSLINVKYIPQWVSIQSSESRLNKNLAESDKFESDLQTSTPMRLVANDMVESHFSDPSSKTRSLEWFTSVLIESGLIEWPNLKTALTQTFQVIIIIVSSTTLL